MEKDFYLNKKLETKIRQLSDSANGPFYAYDSRKILENCKFFTDIPYSPKSIHFAMMANSTINFLKIIRQAGLNIFVNSLLHLEIAKQLGFKAGECVYAASAMDEKTMLKVHSFGATVILDSMGQFNMWNSLFPDSGAGIRCNIGELVVPNKNYAGYFIGKESRLGLSIDSVKTLAGNKSIEGLHIYAGTNITDIDYFMSCYNQLIMMAEWFPNLKYIDFGGGFGYGEKSQQKFNLELYGKKVARLMNEVSEKFDQKIKLLLEPGRIIGIDAGYFVCKVVDIKKRNSQQLVGVNASCVQFPRPLFYPESAFHPVTILSCNDVSGNQSKITSSIYGCSTYSRDFLARDTEIRPTAIGDIVVLGHAGSYCATAHTSFLGFPKAKEYFL